MPKVLDASALLALLHQEPGHEEVAKYLPEAIISSVNYAEVLSIMAQNGISEQISKSLLHGLIKEIIPFDYTQAETVAKLRPATKSLGLSLGDRACLSLAIHTKSTAVTADRAWQKIAYPHLKIVCIR